LNLLAVETSTEACSCALMLEGACQELFELAPRRHGELMLPMMDRLLADAGIGLADLDALAFGRGPGAFTGVRIATAAVQAIAFARDLPVAPVSSLQALAQGAYRELGHEAVLAAFDARMNEVYWGAYQLRPPLLEPALPEQVCAPEAVPVPEGGTWFGVGMGWASYREPLAARVKGALAGMAPERYPHAQDVAVLGAALAARGGLVPAELALPVYLRDKVV